MLFILFSPLPLACRRDVKDVPMIRGTASSYADSSCHHVGWRDCPIIITRNHS